MHVAKSLEEASSQALLRLSPSEVMAVLQCCARKARNISKFVHGGVLIRNVANIWKLHKHFVNVIHHKHV